MFENYLGIFVGLFYLLTSKRNRLPATGCLDAYCQVILGRNDRLKISQASHYEIYLKMFGLKYSPASHQGSL